MRKYFLICMILMGILNSICLYSIDDAEDKNNSRLNDFPSDIFRGNFAVPDAPAFNLLDEYPSNILRPSDVNEFVVGISDLFNMDNGIISPKAIAIEFSPAILISGKQLTLDKYKKNSFLYRMRISIATHTTPDESKIDRIALGLRLSFLDDSDLRKDKGFLNPNKERNKKIITRIQEIYDRRETTHLSSKERKEIKEMILPYREEQENENWNKKILEIACAVSTFAPSDSEKRHKFDKFSFWGTLGVPIKTKLQLLVGYNYLTEKFPFTEDSERTPPSTLSSLLYYGNNQSKLYAEVQCQASGSLFKPKIEQTFLNFGGEINIFDKMWAVFAIGLEHIGGSGTYSPVTTFNLKFDTL